MKLQKLIGVLLCAGLMSCDAKQSDAPAAHAEGTATGMTNRVDIPAAVRQNLGVTFAKVEARNVEQTIRVPGHFELLPDARREYRAAAGGQIEILVSQFQAVAPGTPLYRIESPRWRELQEQIATAESELQQTGARLKSMKPLRESHKKHEESLASKVQLWTERLKTLEALRDAGGGSGRELAEVQGTLNATQAELADVTEKDAELESREHELTAELTASESRLDLLLDSAASMTGLSRDALLEHVDDGGKSRPKWHAMSSIEVRAAAKGVVELLGATNGSFVDANALVIAVIQAERVRFRARGLQSDLNRLSEGLSARIAPAAGGSVAMQDTMSGPLVLGLTGDPAERTIELFLTPTTTATWARAGVAAFLEITVAGGSEQLAIPMSSVARDGVRSIIFRRDPKNPDKAIRMEADLGVSDGRWVVINSGVAEGDEVVLDGVYPLLLATAGNAPKGGHFHSDGTFHEGED